MSSRNVHKRALFARFPWPCFTGRFTRPAFSLARVRQFITALIAIIAITAHPVAAQTVLRDAETEALFRDMVAPLVQASELDAEDVEVVLINSSEVNAFVAGGQRIYF